MKRALVIGSGNIAKRHIKNIRELYPNADVVCCSSSGRQIKASDVGATRVAESLEEAILNEPDFAIVASPANLHLAHAASILKANIPVLIEKPLCLNVAQLTAFNFNRTSTKLAVGYNLRFLPAAKLVKEIISSDSLGKIFSAFSEVGQYLPDWRPESDHRYGVSAQKELGGGALLELSHELDYLTWFFGNMSEVSAKLGYSDTLDIEVEDCVDALMTTKTGVVVHVHLDFLQRAASRTFKIIAENATLTWDLLKNEVVLQEPNSQPKVIFSDPAYDRNMMYKDQVSSFVDGNDKNFEVASTITSATEVMRLVEAIRLSSVEKAWVELSSIK